MEPRAQPLGRRARGHVAEDAADVAGTALEVLDPDVHRLLVDDGGIVDLRDVELTVEQRRDLACDAHHGEQVDAVHGRRRVEDAVADREHVDERAAGLEAVRQQHDPGVVVAEADLVLGEDHPPRSLAPELALVERHVEDREVRAGERDRDRGPASKFQAPQTIWRASPSPTST